MPGELVQPLFLQLVGDPLELLAALAPEAPATHFTESAAEQFLVLGVHHTIAHGKQDVVPLEYVTFQELEILQGIPFISIG